MDNGLELTIKSGDFTFGFNTSPSFCHEAKRWSSMLRLHALYHDVFGRIYLKTKKGFGYTYFFRNCIFKGSPLCGHLTELLSCILFGKNIGRMIVNTN